MYNLLSKNNNMFDIGLGLTTRCNASCKHCYSQPLGRNTDISFESVNKLIHSIRIKSINLGTGESGLHPEFQKIFDLLSRKISEISITSNGYTLSLLTDQQLKVLHDVDLSIDFPDAELHNSFRQAKLFDLAIGQLQRCKELNVRCSVATAVTSENIDYLIEMLDFVREYEIALRLNLYKEIGPKNLTPSYEKFWSVFQVFLEKAKIVSCSEPILSVVLGLNDNSFKGSPCSTNSIRIRPNGKVHRCVYLSGDNDSDYLENNDVASIIENLKHPKHIPLECKSCKHVDFCQGGCESRRLLHSGIAKPDIYCPYLRGDEINIQPKMDEHATPEDYIHSSYLCTLIVK